MRTYLLDANVLIALSWPDHVWHSRVGKWFVGHARAGWATCPFTQAAFVRVLSNPAFSPNALTAENATAVLKKNLELPHHQFWPDAISFVQAAESLSRRLTGHQQVTDAYLVGLALHRGGKLATLDAAIAGWAPVGVVEVIS